MVNGQKRKSRWSTVTPSKLMILSKPSSSTKHPRSSQDENPLVVGAQTDGAASLIRRNSARLLSFIGLKSSNGKLYFRGRVHNLIAAQDHFLQGFH